MAGSIEGCAYIAARLGEHAEAARLLAAARQIRERTAIPVFNFWIPHQQSTLALLRAHLPPEEFAAQDALGLAMRWEDAANDARALLGRMAGRSGSVSPR